MKWMGVKNNDLFTDDSTLLYKIEYFYKIHVILNNFNKCIV